MTFQAVVNDLRMNAVVIALVLKVMIKYCNWEAVWDADAEDLWQSGCIDMNRDYIQVFFGNSTVGTICCYCI